MTAKRKRAPRNEPPREKGGPRVQQRPAVHKEKLRDLDVSEAKRSGVLGGSIPPRPISGSI